MAIKRASTSTALNGFPKYPSMWDQSTYAATFDCIGTVVLSSTQSSIIFAGIPQTYTNLQLRCLTQQNTSVGIRITFNGVTASSYNYHYMYTDPNASTMNSNNSTAASYASVLTTVHTAASTDTYSYSPLIVDIPDYTSPNKYKVLKYMGGTDTNGGGNRGVEWGGASLMNNAAITTITITTGGTSFSSASRFDLYGLK